MRRAAEAKGKVEAGLTLPDFPDDCRVKEPYAARQIDDEARVVIRRADRALDRANDRGARCVEFYDVLKAGIKAGHPE